MTASTVSSTERIIYLLTNAVLPNDDQNSHLTLFDEYIENNEFLEGKRTMHRGGLFQF